jgi:hemolysin activation/secretion protein
MRLPWPIPQPPANAEAASKVVLPGTEIPQGAETVRFTLKAIKVEGAPAFPASDIEGLYRDYLNKEITLDTVWKIAAMITRHYEDAGYFLSRAVVPLQDIKGGVVRIRVVEGYVEEVRLDDPLAGNRIVAELIERLKEERPARSQTVEGILLRLNDLPGVSFRSVIEPVEDETKNDGAVRLLLIREEKKGIGSVSFDNYSSRYLGPFEGAASYETSLLPLQGTSVSSLVGVPARKLEYWSASHVIPLKGNYTLP